MAIFMNVKFLVLPLFSFALCSCSTSADYLFGLTSVNVPTDGKDTYGPREETDAHITKWEERVSDNSYYRDKRIVSRFETEDFAITFKVKNKPAGVYLKLENKTEHPMRVNTGRAAYIGTDSISCSVTSGRLNKAAHGMIYAPVIAAPHAKTDCVLLPMDYMPDFVNRNDYGSALVSGTTSLAQYYIGKKVKLLLPIEIRGTENNYVFTFRVEGYNDEGKQVYADEKEPQKAGERPKWLNE